MGGDDRAMLGPRGAAPIAPPANWQKVSILGKMKGPLAPGETA